MDAETKILLLQNQIDELKDKFKSDVNRLENQIKELEDSCKITSDKVIVNTEKIKSLENMHKTINGIAVGTAVAVIAAFINLVMK